MLCIVIGAALAAFGVLESVELPGSRLEDDVAASVDGRSIHRSELERAVRAVTQDRSSDDLGALSELRKRVLARLVDEELLILRAIELELPHRDTNARKNLIAAMIDLVLAEGSDDPPSDEDLEALFASQRERFVRTTAVALSRIHFKDLANRPPSKLRAQQAFEALSRNEPFDEVRDRFGDSPDFPLPPGWIEPSTLANHIGPAFAEAALKATAGKVSPPLPSENGFDLLLVHEHKRSDPKHYSERTQELTELWERNRDERLLDRYLRELRAAHNTRVAAEFARVTND